MLPADGRLVDTHIVWLHGGGGLRGGANSGSSDTLDVLPADGCLIDNHIVWLHGGRQQGGG